MADNKGQQGSGRHLHKSSDEPWPHTKEQDARHGRSHSSRDDDNRSHETQSHGRDHDRAQNEDLKRREYRGEDGEIHHRTRTYMEQHGGSHGDRNDDSSRDREHAHSGNDNRPSGRETNRSDRGR